MRRARLAQTEKKQKQNSTSLNKPLKIDYIVKTKPFVQVGSGIDKVRLERFE